MMRRSLQPFRYLKSVACAASIFTMCLSPIAQGKAAQTQSQIINDFVKSAGLSKGTTVGEFWKLVRHAYPKPLQGQLDAWVAVNRNQMMPKVEVTAVKDRNGVEQFRLAMNSNGETATVTLTGDDAKPLKINNTLLTSKELTNYKGYNELFAKVAAGDSKLKKNLPLKPMNLIGQNPVLSLKEFKSLTPRQRAEYLVKMRMTIQAAQKVYEVKYGAQASADHDQKYMFALEFLFGEEAEAASSSLKGKSCVYSGYLTKYGENGTCGGAKVGEKDYEAKKSASIASCPGQDQPCHPMVYGYKSDGSNYCVPYAKRNNATAICGDSEHSPLNSPKDKKRIIESWLAKRGKNLNLVLDADGKVPPDQRSDVELDTYLKGLNAYIKDTVAECDKDPLKGLTEQKKYENQKWACDAIRTRAFDLQAFAANPVPVIIPPAPPAPAPVVVDSCDPARDVNPDGTCGDCKGGTKPEQGKKEDGTTGEVCGLIVAAAGGGDLPGPKEPKEKEEDKKCKGLICPLPLIIGAALLVGGLIWAKSRHKDKKKDDPVYTPPIAVDPGTPVTPVEPPITVPNPECLPPRVIQNNQCVLIIDTLPPPTLPSEGGTLLPAPDMGAGVR
jgi:hypothetical protein